MRLWKERLCHSVTVWHNFLHHKCSNIESNIENLPIQMRCWFISIATVYRTPTRSFLTSMHSPLIRFRKCICAWDFITIEQFIRLSYVDSPKKKKKKRNNQLKSNEQKEEENGTTVSSDGWFSFYFIVIFMLNLMLFSSSFGAIAHDAMKRRQRMKKKKREHMT